jgi:hypothetical protein
MLIHNPKLLRLPPLGNGHDWWSYSSLHPKLCSKNDLKKSLKHDMTEHFSTLMAKAYGRPFSKCLVRRPRQSYWMHDDALAPQVGVHGIRS